MFHKSYISDLLKATNMWSPKLRTLPIPIGIELLKAAACWTFSQSK